MAGRYTLPARVSLRGDTRIASSYIGRARTILGELTERLALQGIESGAATRQFGGVTIRVQHSGNTASIDITAGAQSTSSPAFDTDASLWIPTGFVVYPANDAAPGGWGAPAVPNHADPYNATNLAPGLSPARWTIDGPLGQVLLTRSLNAGYPQLTKLIPPLLFHREFELKPDDVPAPVSAPWTGYRMEFVEFRANSETMTPLQAAAAAIAKKYVFEHVNALRADIDLNPVMLPLRGYTDTAQVTAEILFDTHTLGHYSERFPATYQTIDDRISKDGVTYIVTDAETANNRNKLRSGGENSVAAGSDVTLLGTDPNGVNIYNVGTQGANLSGQDAFDSWVGSPPHYANMVNTAWDNFDTTTTIGFKNNYATQHFVRRDHWIQCGNRYWQSVNADLPPLTWFGFHSMNLAWETWPVIFNNNDGSGPPAEPLLPLGDLIEGTDDKFWLRYDYAGKGYQHHLTRPALDSRLFCRGRAIAVAPDNSSIWAAAVQVHSGFHRIIILTHHVEDQNADTKTYGMTSYLRVWYADVENFSQFVANPETVICNKYGQENVTYPWDFVNNPYSWRGGELVDVGTSTGASRDLLKYASQWVFSDDGTKAICLRDYGRYDQYSSLYIYSDSPYYMADGRPSTALEMFISLDAVPVVTKEWYGRNAGYDYQNYALPDLPGEELSCLVYNDPIAAAYDGLDNAIFCFSGAFIIDDTSTVPPIGVFEQHLSFHGWGSYDLTFTTGLEDIAYHGSATKLDDHDTPFCPRPCVLDVRDRITVSTGTVQRLRYTLETGAPYRANPAYPCWAGTDEDYIRVTARRGSTVLADKFYPNPDSIVVSPGELCYSFVDPFFGYWYNGTTLRLSASTITLASYAKRGSAWVLSWVVQPQQDIVKQVTDFVSSDCFEVAISSPCAPSGGNALNSIDLVQPLGGGMVASFADEAALITMADISSDGARFLYVRPV